MHLSGENDCFKRLTGYCYSFYFCVHLNRPVIHLFISCCTHSLFLYKPAPTFAVCWSPAVRMDTRLSFPRYPLLVLLCAVAALSGTRSPVAAAGRSCSDTRQVYSEKGYSTGTAPLTQISGKTLHLACGWDKLHNQTISGTHVGTVPLLFKKITGDLILIQFKILYGHALVCLDRDKITILHIKVLQTHCSAPQTNHKPLWEHYSNTIVFKYHRRTTIY